jgi:flavin reductase (DIM6/NTAB) family NADH-FMN oxidoreductase RutF
MNINKQQIAEMEKYYRTTLINSLPGYRSLHLVGTINRDGITNLALFNSVFHLGANPALLGMVVRPDVPGHDTLENIRTIGQYTLNNVLPQWYPQAHQTSASYPSGESEFDVCGFKKVYANGFKAPFVKESTINIGLELRDTIDIEINNTTIVIGEIVHISIDEKLVAPDGYVDHIAAKTVTVAGLDSYFLTEPLGRMAYAKVGREPKELVNENETVK